MINDWDSRGALSQQASRILMKILRCARLARPDLSKATADLTRRLTVWSKADDIRLHRLLLYLYGSKDLCLQGKIADPQESCCAAIPMQTIAQLRRTQRAAVECSCVLKGPTASGLCRGQAVNKRPRQDQQRKPK